MLVNCCSVLSNKYQIYSHELLIHNFHNLLHLPEDVKNFGKLDSFSAFPFENFMKEIKHMVRGPNNKIQQVVKRLGETNSRINSKVVNNKVKSFPENGKVKCVPFSCNSKCTIGTGMADGCFLIKTKKVVVVKEIFDTDVTGCI